ncbi:MAG: hypothetical protein Q7R30_08880 [Acidobacteriota bacterium]|nr:hypothetical protein [Acidobacteriota bacterium]
MPYLKNEAPPEALETIRQLEAQADECWRPLRILQDPPNVAIWALLTGGIERVEREQAARGSNTPHFDAMLANLSIGELFTYDWLPAQDRDFRIQYDRAAANGVTIESPVFVERPVFWA